MKKVVLALGVSLGALALAACDAQQEQAEAAEPQAEVAPAPVETAPVTADEAVEAEEAAAMPAEGVDAEVAPPAEGEAVPTN